ncbi:DUF6446 family protein [Citreimonas salinaria]|uniref:Histidine kinase n=1 Tax=Citreimonas salinaria TaxID=321339 RepID=A0A1H3K0R9_9RHOB|nr:DUF6446 family protein [Citreimonas salinaria]SDY45776.1 hypothetical protein SAMN05444340_108100 [Citreimonas salinaria]
MHAGKILAIVLILCAIVAGAGMYYLQVFHYYEEAPMQDSVRLTGSDGTPIDLPVRDFRAIDAESSPIRFRACFRTDASLDTLDAEIYPRAIPRRGPFWFDCFDADAVGAAIAEGSARVFTGQRNLEFGIDRVVAITNSGRGYIWHEVNECGDRAYDGTPLGEDCPPRD